MKFVLVFSRSLHNMTTRHHQLYNLRSDELTLTGIGRTMLSDIDRRDQEQCGHIQGVLQLEHDMCACYRFEDLRRPGLCRHVCVQRSSPCRKDLPWLVRSLPLMRGDIVVKLAEDDSWATSRICVMRRGDLIGRDTLN